MFEASAPVRFIIVGGVNTLVSFLVYLLLLAVGLPFPIANLGSLLFGIGVSFMTQSRIVFGNSDIRNIVPFVAGWLMIYVGQTSLIWLLVRHGLAASTAGLIVLPLTVLTSYIFQKFWVFNRRRPAGAAPED